MKYIDALKTLTLRRFYVIITLAMEEIVKRGENLRNSKRMI